MSEKTEKPKKVSKDTKTTAKKAASPKTEKKSNNYAVIQSGAHQYYVTEGAVLDIEKVSSESESITFDNIALVSDGKKVQVGQPFVKNATVKATILDQYRDAKVTVFKFKKKTGYKKKQGHRQDLTQIKIESISA